MSTVKPYPRGQLIRLCLEVRRIELWEELGGESRVNPFFPVSSLSLQLAARYMVLIMEMRAINLIFSVLK